MNRGSWKFVRLVLVMALVAGLGVFVAAIQRLSTQPLNEAPLGAAQVAEVVEVVARPWTFSSNQDCRECHLEIWEEWSEDQHSQAWFNQPLLVPDPKRTECNNCHAPRPILEVGIEALPLIRAERFEEGVGCLECHRNGERVEGPLPGRDAACNPTFNELFTDSRICSSCHAPHGSYEQWQGSEWAARGTTCQACHMPLVERPTVTGGPLRRVRTHRMRSQRDATLLEEAVTLEAGLEDGELVVTLANTGAGHSVPGEIYNRELFVRTRFLDASGAALDQRRESLKAVRREQRGSLPSTQLPAGEWRTWRYAPAPGTRRIEVLVGYKFFFMEPDEYAVRVHERELELP